MESLREGAVVCRQELAQVVKSGRAAALALLASLGALLAAAIFVWVNRQLFEGTPIGDDPAARAFAAEALGKGLAWLVGGDEAAARTLAYQRIPPLMLFSFWLSRSILPLVAVVLVHDAMAREVGTRSLRFVLLRARRGSVLLGKAAAQLLLLLALVGLASLVVLGYGVLRQEGFELGPAAGFLVRAMGATVFQGAAYVSLVMVASCAASRGAQALVGSLILVFALWVAGLLAHAQTFRFLGWLVPSRYEPFLIAGELGERLAGLGAYAGFAAVYLAAAYVLLRRRDA